MTKTQRYLLPAIVIFFIAFGFFVYDHYRHGLPRIPAPSDQRAQPVLKVIPVELPDGTRIAAEVAWTEQQKQKGLMYRTELPPQTGMILVHKNQDYHQIWMKNMYLDLDILFINEEKTVVSIAKRVPHSKPGDPDEEKVAKRTALCKYVLELAAGEADRLKITKGSDLAFKLSSQP